VSWRVTMSTRAELTGRLARPGQSAVERWAHFRSWHAVIEDAIGCRGEIPRPNRRPTAAFAAPPSSRSLFDRPQGSGLFKIPLEEGPTPVRLVSGEAMNPVWSPDGGLIVYGGAVVGGQVTLLGVTPDATPVRLPDVRARLGGGHRFLPNGAGLLYLPRAQSLDFWLLDLTTKETRALTRLGDHGILHTFDVMPDGRFIVFDRSRENSDIVLIDLPK
jgi:hypothetical protein